MRLLIVDDEPSILELLGVALKALGTYKVKTASSAKQALSMIEGKPREFDAFLIDIQMPGMNGIDLVAELRKNDLYKSAPILMLTAMSQMSYVEKAFEAGATDYVTKPFNFEDLKQRLKTAKKLKYSKAAAEGEDDPSMVRSVLYSGKHDYAAELDFSKVDRFIGKSEFENYVRQMSMSKASNTCAFALRVANGAEINGQVPSMDFHKTFLKIAQALVEGTAATGSLMSYVGNGLFLCAEHGNRLTNTDNLEQVIASMISRTEFAGPRPRIAIGRHAELDGSDHAAGEKLLKDAISNAAAREDVALDVHSERTALERPLPRTQTAEAVPTRPTPVAQASRARPDRKAYEKMLLESLRNG